MAFALLVPATAICCQFGALNGECGLTGVLNCLFAGAVSTCRIDSVAPFYRRRKPKDCKVFKSPLNWNFRESTTIQTPFRERGAASCRPREDSSATQP